MTSGPPLSETAGGFIAALPGSVELPAGTGKTELLAETARLLGDDGARTLVLTHTNAGVHAVQDRLNRLGRGAVQGCIVSTITSFAFGLVRPYRDLAGLEVPERPVMADSDQYVAAAIRVAKAPTIQRVLAASFDHLLVDEYQDCSRNQHEFVCELAAAVPKTGVLGDPMQAIFGFADQLVPWPEVQARFPDHRVPTHPWRWDAHNAALGAWLLDLRRLIYPGATVDFTDSLPPGVTFEQVSTPAGKAATLSAIAYRSWPADETVLVLAGRYGPQTRSTAARLAGRFSAMEELGGTFMRSKLISLAQTNPGQYARWLAGLIKECFCGHGKLDKAVLTRLEAGKPVASLIRPGLESALDALDSVIRAPALGTVAAAMDSARSAPSLQLHSDEAWFDIQAAIRGAAGQTEPSSALLAELDKARDRIRHGGRRARTRVVSRTLLVKGLEFDHVVIADTADVRDQCNLYVALTRARKTITIFGQTPLVTVESTRTAS